MKGKSYHHAGVHYQAATRSPPILSFLLVFFTLEDETTMYSEIVRHQSSCDAAPHHRRTDTSIDLCESIRTNIRCSD